MAERIIVDRIGAGHQQFWWCFLQRIFTFWQKFQYGLRFISGNFYFVTNVPVWLGDVFFSFFSPIWACLLSMDLNSWKVGTNFPPLIIAFFFQMFTNSLASDDNNQNLCNNLNVFKINRKIVNTVWFHPNLLFLFICFQIFFLCMLIFFIWLFSCFQWILLNFTCMLRYIFVLFD